MRRTIITLGLLLPIAACAGGDDDWTSRSSQQQSGAAYAPTVPPQAGQSGQTSQQARRNLAAQPGGQQALSGTTGKGAMSGTGAMQLSAAEQMFIMEAAQHGMGEVELGRLAEQRGNSAQVRDFGRMMVQQHTQANQELMGVAQRLGVTPPTTLPPSAQAAQTRLQMAQGQDFDRQYIEQQAAAHLAQRSMFQFAANNARTPELRGFAQRTLPVVERHIEQLRTIAPTAMRTGS
jgi:putative membrane protein